MRIKTSIVLMAAAFSVASCGGGGKSSNHLNQPVKGTPESYDQLVQASNFDSTLQRGLDLFDKYEALDGDEVVNLPVTGTAKYKGVTAFQWGTPLTDLANSTDFDQLTDEQERQADRALIRQADINSDISLAVDFAQGSFSGQLDNFKTNLNEPIEGVVSVRNGHFLDDIMHAEVSGILTEGKERYRVTADLGGILGGNNADVAYGAITGYVEDAQNIENIQGIFVTEKQ